MSDTDSAPYWATVQCQPRRERVAEHFLRQFGFEAYLPRIRRYRFRWRRRIEMLAPLFPGYCFARIKLQWHGVKQCPGVIRIVKSGGDAPAQIPDRVIDAIRSRERDGALDLPKPGKPRVLKVGDRVLIRDGLFAGRFGVCARTRRQQVEVLLFLFGSQRAVRLHRDMIEAV